MDPEYQVKLIMQWDIKQDLDQEYFEFIVREFVPSTTEMGLQTIGVWYTAYSRVEMPKIRLEVLAESLESVRRTLNGGDWQQLHNKLLEYVDNYQQKVIRFSGNFQV